MKLSTVDDKPTVFRDNKVIGYVENHMLYGIDRDGYATPVCTIEHNSEIIAKLTAWEQIHGRPSRRR